MNWLIVERKSTPLGLVHRAPTGKHPAFGSWGAQPPRGVYIIRLLHLQAEKKVSNAHHMLLQAINKLQTNIKRSMSYISLRTSIVEDRDGNHVFD